MTSPNNNNNNNTNNLQSLSVTSCINSIVSFFNSQDNNSQWKSLTNSTEGSFLIRLLSTVISNLSYKIVSYVREIFLSTCTLLSSALGTSVNLGYSAYRGSNQRRIITITPTQTVTVPKFSSIGTYSSDYNIINVDDLYLQVGQTVDITVVIGNVNSIQQTAGTADLKVFTFYTQNISEDLILLKDGIEVPFSKKPGGMANDMYWLRTNPYSSVDILYLNNVTSPTYSYASGTVFTLAYIELSNVPTIPFTSDMFTYLTLNNTRTIEQYIPPETIDSIKVTAPYYHETQNVIRSKEDFAKELPEMDTSIITSNYSVIVPTYAALSYIKNDYSLLTEAELTNIINKFNNQRFLGTPLPDIVPSNIELITLNISFRYNNKFTTLSNVNNDIINLLSTNYYRLLGNNFSTLDLQDLFQSNLSYVRNAEVSVLINNWVASTYYNLGDVIEVNDIYYRATAILGESGSLEPNWSIPVQTSSEIDLSFITNNITGNVIINTEDAITVGPPVIAYSTTFIGNITLGSNIVTGIISTANLSIGIPISCTGIPEGTIITSVDSSSQIHISQNATSTVSPATFSYNLLPVISMGTTGINYLKVYGNQPYAIGTVIGLFINNELFQSLIVQNITYNNITNITTIYVNEEIGLITVNINSTITTDNSIIWKTYKRLALDSTQISEWRASTPYKIGDYVYSSNFPNYMFKVIDLVKYSEASLPASFTTSANLGGIGTFVYDGDLLWVGVLLNDSDPVWAANTNYRLGDRVQVGTYSYVLVGYRGKSSLTQPVFELSSYPISSQSPIYFGFIDLSSNNYNSTGIEGYLDVSFNSSNRPGTWIDETIALPTLPSSYFEISGDYVNFFSVDGIIQVYTSTGTAYSFSVGSVSYNSMENITIIGVNQSINLSKIYSSIEKANVGTNDTNVFWEIVDDIGVYQGNWNVYNTFNYNLATL